MSDRSTSRRQFLAATGAALGLAPLLAACGGGGGDVTAAEGCEGYDALTQQDLQSRAALNYVDNTPIPEQRCDNCQFFVEAAGEGNCGGCQLFAGPVVAGGYCVSWVPAPAA